MTAEEWRPVPGFPGYAVSSLGRVWSGRRGRGRILRNLDTADTHYLAVSLCAIGQPKVRRYVHQLVAEAFLGPRPAGHHVRHIDGDKQHNVPGNLAWGSISDNILDQVRHGRHHNARKTHCPAAHEYTPENTYVIPSKGSRMCRTCMAERRRAS